MKIKEALERIKKVCIPAEAHPVLHTAAEEIRRVTKAEIEEGSADNEKGGFLLGVDKGMLQRGESGIFVRLDRDGAGRLIAAREAYLFGFVHHFLNALFENDLDSVQEGRFFPAAFSWQRATYDFFLTQEGRVQRRLDRATYIRRLAESGLTHIEINGLAFPMGLESGPEGETYPMFYTYCPALDQFVDTELNKGLYPSDYLAANLNYLKENARLAEQYGLVPGLLCFEPRSVPEAFFDRYPMLRGARVDHPFRSFKPRYNMTITHPKVRAHYQEMLGKIMDEVPELGYMTIWTNDSGAGFEHTKSLYVGRNGGAYLIREWKDDQEIARLAGENALQFLEALKEAGQKINPDFRVITRLESFYGEHDTVWNGLGERLEVETASLIARGWEMPYTHPRYPDSNAINAGTIYQDRFDVQEKICMADLNHRNACAHFYFTAGPHTLFAPLIGVPYPHLTYRRLKMLFDQDVQYLAHLGGTAPPELVPFNINHEIVRAFQYDPELDGEKEIQRIARVWAGDTFADTLVQSWKDAEQAILAFPHVTPLYSTMGFVWYRLWARPLVPNIEALPESERAYYENFMCTTPHNPNNVDLSRDVLFQLTDLEASRKALERIDQNLWESMDRAIEALEKVRASAQDALGANNVIEDQAVRLKALRCWFMTQRNVAAWIVGVHGYLETKDPSCRTLLSSMIDKEIENSARLADLIDSGIEFMAVTDQEETPLIHGDNLKELLKIRVALMKKHRDDEPFIDSHYIEKNAGKSA